MEQIELNVQQQDQVQQGEHIHLATNSVSSGMLESRQRHFIKKGRLQFTFLKRVTLTLFIYRIFYVVLCLIPFYKCPFSCGNTLENILLLICVGLELLKVTENIYAGIRVNYYLKLFKQSDDALGIPFSSNDIQNLYTLKFAIDKIHRKAFYCRIFINIVWFLYYLVYTTLYFSFTSSGNIAVYFLLIIFCLDSIFFIFPIFMNTICFIGQLIVKCFKSHTSRNKKILRQLHSEKYKDNIQLTDENICIICWDNFRNEDVYTQLQCNKKHVFHTTCIQTWIKTHTTCPVCRSELS